MIRVKSIWNFSFYVYNKHLFFRMRVIEYERVKKVDHKQKTLIISSEDGKWCITRAFLNCRSKVFWSHAHILLRLKEEVEQYYSSMCDDDMTEQFQKYEDEGICSDAYSDVIIHALSNVFKVNILIYNNDERAACYFIAKEKDCIFPTRNIYVEHTVSILKEGNLYSALQDIPGKYTNSENRKYVYLKWHK